jgi:hypothetical protein
MTKLPEFLTVSGLAILLVAASTLGTACALKPVSISEEVIAVSKPAANDDAVNPEPEMPPANVTMTVTTAPEQDAKPEAVSFIQPCQSETCNCKPCYCLDGCKCGVAHKFVGSVDAGNQCLACWEVKSHPLHANASAVVSPVAIYNAPAGRYVQEPVYGPLGRQRGYRTVWQPYQAPRQYIYQTRYYVPSQQYVPPQPMRSNCANGRCN